MLSFRRSMAIAKGLHLMVIMNLKTQFSSVLCVCNFVDTAIACGDMGKTVLPFGL